MKLQPILRNIRRADQDYNLIEPGDKIAVALSGGKDSMLLFLALSMYQKFKGKDFELIGIHCDVGFEEFDHTLMKEFAREHNLDLEIVQTRIFPILQLDKNRKNDGNIDCSLCSTLKKGVLFEKAKEMGCNKVAYGHHGDDAAETLLMNMIYSGKAAIFRPKQYMSRMDMDIIRPLVYCKEEEIIKACKDNDVPSVKRVCPNDGHTRRQDMKEMLEEVYKRYPQAHDNILNALSNDDQLCFWHPQKPEKI